MALTRRDLLASGAGAILILGPKRLAAQAPTITPERFGAVGDGRTNDTAAFAAMAAFVNSRGGGEIVLRKTTYVVGRQVRSAGRADHFAFEPASIMDFRGCRQAMIIRGNGARLRCAPALRFGSFDPVSGRATHRPMPSYRIDELAAPYRAMIRAEECSGLVEISDLELDGNLGALQIGGQHGDVGWQIPGIGIHLINNSGPERLSRIHAHHHPLDGILIDGVDGRSAESILQSVRSEYNGRQACSITGGRNYVFSRCSFNHSGKGGGISSPPGAGVDIEAEGGKRIRNLRFSDCRFSDNAGVGLLAEAGDAERATFDNCTFVGTTSWGAWPNKPRFRFSRCTFVGAIVNAFGDADPWRACQFRECEFRDEPALSPNGLVYVGDKSPGPIAVLPNSRNVLFDRCGFRLTHRAVLPWATNVTVFSNCTMSQRAPAQAYPRGMFIGRNVITGNVDLYSARIEGELIVNGRRVS
jgi:hypothetical protein